MIEELFGFKGTQNLKFLELCAVYCNVGVIVSYRDLDIVPLERGVTLDPMLPVPASRTTRARLPHARMVANRTASFIRADRDRKRHLWPSVCDARK